MFPGNQELSLVSIKPVPTGDLQEASIVDSIDRPGHHEQELCVGASVFLKYQRFRESVV
jgi:hypothetical protein